MMPRLFLVWLLLASTVGWLVYQMKYEVQAREAKLLRTNREIVDEQEATHVLYAEWAYVNGPRHIEQLAQLTAPLVPMRNRQIVDLAQIPMRGDPTPPAAAAAPKATPVLPQVDLDEDETTRGVPQDDVDTAPATPTPGPATLLMVRGKAAQNPAVPHDH
jgi:hypothetical protein